MHHAVQCRLPVSLLLLCRLPCRLFRRQSIERLAGLIAASIQDSLRSAARSSSARSDSARPVCAKLTSIPIRHCRGPGRCHQCVWTASLRLVECLMFVALLCWRKQYCNSCALSRYPKCSQRDIWKRNRQTPLYKFVCFLQLAQWRLTGAYYETLPLSHCVRQYCRFIIILWPC